MSRLSGLKVFVTWEAVKSSAFKTLFKWPISCKFKSNCNVTRIWWWNNIQLLQDLELNFIYRNTFLRILNHLVIESCFEMLFERVKDNYIKRLKPVEIEVFLNRIFFWAFCMISEIRYCVHEDFITYPSTLG